MPKGDAKADYLNTNAHLEAKVSMLERVLAESQSREVKLREKVTSATQCHWAAVQYLLEEALAIPQDDSALREMIEAAKAEERESCLACYSPDDTANDWADKIRARGGK